MTKIKYTELKTELDNLIQKGRRDVADELERARREGENISEDSTYTEALDKQIKLEDRIIEISEQIKNAQIIEKDKTDTRTVQVGSEVIVEFSGKQDKYVIVGEVEANPLEGKISNDSPLGSAMLGKKEGDTVVVKTPIVRMKYKIIEII